MTPSATLGGLFLSAFLSATLLPGTSELVLAGVLLHDATLFWSALCVATVGNTLGGFSTYLIGRVLPKHPRDSREVRWLRRMGSPVLLFSWVPVIGDALCLAAGWLRVHAGWVTLYLALGKFARYWVIAKALSGS